MVFIDVDIAVAIPVNIMPLLDDTDFKTRETTVAYNAAGMDLVWNFVTSAGVTTQTAVTPTTSGDYDWSHVGDGMYKIEIPASAGASINNNTEGVGWFSGVATGVLPWVSPMYCFRAAGLNDLLIDSAYSATRGLAGTALPAAAADAAGGLPISDAGGLDLDAKIGALTYGTANRVNAQVYGMEAGTVTAGAIAAAALNGKGDWNIGKTGYALSAAGVQAIWDALTSALTVVDSIGKLLVDNVNATISSRASQTSVDDLPTNAELATALGTADDATLAAIAALNNLSAAQVNAEVDTALADIHLDHLLAVTYDPASKPGAADALLNQLVESDAGVARYTANALEQAPTGGSAPTAAEIADAVWDEDATGHQTQGTFGQAIGDPGADTDTIWALANTNLDAAISSRMATYAQPTGFLTATFPATVASTTNITGGTITTVTNLTNAPTAGDLTATMKASVNTEVDTAIADARLDELLAADSDIDGASPPTMGSVFHELMSKTAGSFTFDQTTDSLEALRDRGDAAWVTSTFSITASAIADEVQTRTIAGVTLVATTTNLTNLPSIPVNWLTAAGTAADFIAEVQTAAAAAITAYDPPTNAELEARTLIAANYFDPAADTVANVTTVGSVTTKTGYALASDGLDAIAITAPAGVAANFREMIVQVWRRLFKKSTLNSTQLKTFADNGSTVITTQAVSDDGTTQTQGDSS